MISWHREEFLSNKNKTAHCGTFCIRLRGVQGVEFPAPILMLSTGIALWPLGRNSTTQLSFLLNSSAGCRSQLHGFTWCRKLQSVSPEQHLSHFATSAIATVRGVEGGGRNSPAVTSLLNLFYSRLLPSWWFWRTPNGFHYSERNNICSTNIVTPREAPHSSSSSLYNITTQHNLFYMAFRRHSLTDTLEKGGEKEK